MNLAWVKHLKTKEAQESFNKKLLSMHNDPIIKRLIELLELELKELNEMIIDQDDPNLITKLTLNQGRRVQVTKTLKLFQPLRKPQNDHSV
jgi:hypothetical protein